MFVEGLGGYDVRLVVDEGCVVITRYPEEGWKPEHQDHLLDGDILFAID
jgi:hypothetical protein